MAKRVRQTTSNIPPEEVGYLAPSCVGVMLTIVASMRLKSGRS
jgi:hypothetical protein